MIDNDIKYIKSMGNYFKLVHIATSVNEANDYCSNNPKTGVIYTSSNDTHILIAEIYPTPSIVAKKYDVINVTSS